MHEEADAILLAAFDDEPEPLSQPALAPAQSPSVALPALAFDILLFDPKRASFLMLYSAGTPLGALKPRIVSLPATEVHTPVVSLTIHRRSATDPQPVPYRTFQFSYDVRGKRLTLRFADPADPNSLILEPDSSHGENGVRDGSRCGQAEFNPL